MKKKNSTKGLRSVYFRVEYIYRNKLVNSREISDFESVVEEVNDIGHLKYSSQYYKGERVDTIKFYACYVCGDSMLLGTVKL